MLHNFDVCSQKLLRRLKYRLTLHNTGYWLARAYVHVIVTGVYDK